jgi:hypothetical protein
VNDAPSADPHLAAVRFDETLGALTAKGQDLVQRYGGHGPSLRRHGPCRQRWPHVKLLIVQLSLVGVR